MKYYQMSTPQKNIFEMIKRYENSCIGNIGGLIRFEDGISMGHLEDTVRRVYGLNAALRMRVNREGLLYLTEEKDIMLEIEDQRDMSELESEEWVKKQVNQPFWGYDKNLTRCYLIQRNGYKVFYGICHHLICDGIGLLKITDELYQWGNDTKCTLWSRDEAVDMSYSEYLEECEKAGGNSFAGVESYLKLCGQRSFQFPKRRESGSVHAGIYHSEIRGHIYKSLTEYCEANSLTAEHVFEAALARFYSEITGKEQVSIGRVMVNRKKKYMDTAGMFANTLPLPIKDVKNKPFLELCRDIRKLEWMMLKCSGLSISELKAFNNLMGDLFETSVTYRPLKRLPLQHKKYIREMECEAVEVKLRIMLDEPEGKLQVTYIYQTDAYEETEVRELDRCLWQIVEQEMRDRIFRLPMMTELSIQPERKRQGAVCDISEAFRKAVRDCPDKTFLIDLSRDGYEISYRKAAKYVDMLKNQLYEEYRRKDIVKPVCLIGLQLARSYYLPVTMLACMEIGMVFVPIYLFETKERLKALKAQLDLFITDQWVENALKKDIAEGEKELKPYCCNQENIAYGIHTSGSTGKPKIVMIYRNALNIRLNWMKWEFGMEGCRVLQKTRNVFDVSIWELLIPALCEGSLVILPDGAERSPKAIAEAVYRYQVDTLHFVPCMLNVFLSWISRQKEVRRKSCLSLRRIFSSGEALQLKTVESFYAIFPRIPLFNLYGPAECTIDVSFHTCVSGDKMVPIGRAAWGCNLFVVNDQGQILPSGYVGEIVVGGELVGKGYLDNPEETQKRFLVKGERRFYYTGDMGYKTTDDNLIYLGRRDREVKLRGMRVNLAVVEKEAVSVTGVEQAAALCIENRLVLFVSPYIMKKKLRGLLAEKVPAHFIPDEFLFVDKIPYNGNGKCDYKALAEMYDKKKIMMAAKGENDDTALEQKILHYIGRLLKHADIRTKDNLADYGMDSLSMVKLLLWLERQGYGLRYEQIAAVRTVKELADIAEADIAIKKEKKSQPVFYCYPDWKPVEEQEIYTKNLIVAASYAGTDIHLFDKLAEKLCEKGYTFWAYHISQDTRSIQDIAKEGIKQIKALGAEQITVTVLGCCVGAALAIETIREIQKETSFASRLVMICALPSKFLGRKEQKKLLWDYFSKEIGSIVVSILYGKKVVLSEKMYETLKEDARRQVEQLEKLSLRRADKQTEALLIYGDRDLMTCGWRKRYREWKDFFTGHVRVCVLKNAYHFCLNTHAEELAARILEWNACKWEHCPDS